MIKKNLYPTCPFFSSLRGKVDKKTGTEKSRLDPKIKACIFFTKKGRLMLYQNNGSCLLKSKNLKPTDEKFSQVDKYLY